MTYEEVIQFIYKGDLSKIPNILLCLDPGETTGFAVFNREKLVRFGELSGTIKHNDINSALLANFIHEIQPTHIVCEDYRIYSHKLKRHAYSRVMTIRLIGAIEFICQMENIPLTFQMAAQAKGFVTDERLRNWGFWYRGVKHARDAIRHGLYFIIVNNQPKG